MPKFLDAPSWYSSNGSQVHGLGSQSSSGFPGNIPEGLVLGLSTIEGASNNGVEGQTYLLPLAPTDATSTSPNQYKGRIAVIAGEASYSPGTGTIYLSTQPVYRKLYFTTVLFEDSISSTPVKGAIFLPTWKNYQVNPSGSNYTMEQWIEEKEVDIEAQFKGVCLYDAPTSAQGGVYSSILGGKLQIIGFGTTTPVGSKIIWQDSLSNVRIIRVWSDVPSGFEVPSV